MAIEGKLETSVRTWRRRRRNTVTQIILTWSGLKLIISEIQKSYLLLHNIRCLPIHGEEKWNIGFEGEESQYHTCAFGELGNFGMWFVYFVFPPRFRSILRCLATPVSPSSLSSSSILDVILFTWSAWNIVEHSIHAMRRSLIAFPSSWRSGIGYKRHFADYKRRRRWRRRRESIWSMDCWWRRVRYGEKRWERILRWWWIVNKILLLYSFSFLTDLRTIQVLMEIHTRIFESVQNDWEEQLCDALRTRLYLFWRRVSLQLLLS